MLTEMQSAYFIKNCVVSGLMHPDCCLSSFLLPVLVLLGSDGGVAVVHGSDRPPQESHHSQAFPVSRMGWAFCLLSIILFHLVFLIAPLLNVYFYFPPRSPCTSSGDLSGIYQGKGIWNIKLVSMLPYGFTIVHTPTSLRIYTRILHMVGGLCLQHN